MPSNQDGRAHTALIFASLCLHRHIRSWHNTHTPVPSLSPPPDSPPQLCKQLQLSHLIDSRSLSPPHLLIPSLSQSLLLLAVTAAPSLSLSEPPGSECLPCVHSLSFCLFRMNLHTQTHVKGVSPQVVYHVKIYFHPKVHGKQSVFSEI